MNSPSQRITYSHLKVYENTEKSYFHCPQAAAAHSGAISAPQSECSAEDTE
jgi:hypothetical protein